MSINQKEHSDWRRKWNLHNPSETATDRLNRQRSLGQPLKSNILKSQPGIYNVLIYTHDEETVIPEDYFQHMNNTFFNESFRRKL